MPSVKAQIEGLLVNTESVCAVPDEFGRCCDAIELTREDLIQWGETQPSDTRCKVVIVGAPIVKRPRGMMSTFQKRCVVSGINALYHTLSTLRKNNPPLFRDNAQTVYQRWFQAKECTSKIGEREALRISVEQLTGPMVLLAAAMIFGMINHYCYKKVVKNEIRKRASISERTKQPSVQGSSQTKLDYVHTEPTIHAKRGRISSSALPYIVTGPGGQPQETCMYGDRCYNTTQDHLAKFLHPATAIATTTLSHC